MSKEQIVAIIKRHYALCGPDFPECGVANEIKKYADEELARRPVPEDAPGGLSEEEKAIMAWNGFHGTNDADKLKALVRRLLTPASCGEEAGRRCGTCSSHPDGCPTPAPNREAELKVIEEIGAERERQKSVEGWSPAHDDEHGDYALARAAACYVNDIGSCRSPSALWPWDMKWWKPTTHRRNLIKAAALIVAEIERVDRLASLAQSEMKGEGKL